MALTAPALMIAPIGDADIADVIALRPDNSQVQAFYQSLGYFEQERIVYAKWLDGREPTP